MELCEVLTGWEQKNKYQVKDLRVFWNLIYFSLPDLRLSRTRDLLHEGGKQLLHEVSIQVVRLNVHQAWGNKNNWWFGDFYHLLPRQCCGPNRPFNFHVTDPAGLEVLHFKRFLPTWSWSTYAWSAYQAASWKLEQGLCLRPLRLAKLLLLSLPMSVKKNNLQTKQLKKWHP